VIFEQSLSPYLNTKFVSFFHIHIYKIAVRQGKTIYLLLTYFSQFEGDNLKIVTFRIAVAFQKPSPNSHWKFFWSIENSKKRSVVNFISILCANFSFESKFNSFSLVRFGFVIFAKILAQKARIKCWWNWHLVVWFFSTTDMISHSFFPKL